MDACAGLTNTDTLGEIAGNEIKLEVAGRVMPQSREGWSLIEIPPPVLDAMLLKFGGKAARKSRPGFSPPHGSFQDPHSAERAARIFARPRRAARFRLPFMMYSMAVRPLP